MSMYVSGSAIEGRTPARAARSMTTSGRARSNIASKAPRSRVSTSMRWKAGLRRARAMLFSFIGLG